jgi:polyisoprenoid-binding protein YceI
MTPRTAGLLLVAVVLLAIGGGAVANVVFLRGDEVAPLALPSPAAGGPSSKTGATASAPAAVASGGGSLGPASSASLDPASIPGTWTIGTDSVVGYRVRERLASLTADSDAVGRTSSITGTATIASGPGGMSLSAADFSVDMTSLRSDRQMRDNRLRNDGIQTDQFPTSTFRLTQPVALPTTAASGAQFAVTLHGDLTLHGVTRAIDLQAEAQLSGNVIRVAGSYAFPFTDYQINAPNIGGFVAVQDTGTLEFLINLQKT